MAAELDNCPKCGVSLLGAPIPEKDRRYYDPVSTNYSRTILVEIRGVYDGGLFFMCPDCGGKWHRFKTGHPLHEQAKVFVDDPEWGLRRIDG